MMSFISLILAPAIATGFGWCLTRLFKIYLPFLERLALSYVFGLAGITLLMFYLNILGIPFSAGSALLFPLLSIFYLGLKEKKGINAFLRKPKKKLTEGKTWLLASWHSLSFLEKAILVTIAFLVLTALARALYWPVFYWDAICVYDARAQFFLREGLMTEVAKKVSWELRNYPLFTSLAHTYFYLLGAKNPKILYTLIYITLLVTMYYSLEEHLSRPLAFSLTLLLAANPFILEHAAASYTNLAYTFFLGMGTVYLIRFFDKRKLYLFWTGTFLFALSSWTRPNTELFFLTPLMVLVIFVILNKKHFKRYFWLPVIFSFIFLTLCLPWPYFLKFGLRQEDLQVVSGSKALIMAERVIVGTFQGRISGAMFLRMIRILLASIRQSLNYILYLFLIVFLISLFSKEKLRKTIYPLLFMAFYAGTVFLGVYRFLFTWYWPELISNAVNRFVMIFLPLLIYYVGVIFSELQK